MTPTCFFSCDTQYRLARHEASCTDTTVIKFTERIYGQNADTRKELIDLGVIPRSFKRSVVAYDIESIMVPQQFQLAGNTYHHGYQSPLSIALAGKGFTDFWLRKDMSEDAISSMVQKFLIRLECLANQYYNSLPSGLKAYYDAIKTELKTEKPSVHRKSQIYSHMRYIKGLFRLTAMGFNSQV